MNDEYLRALFRDARARDAARTPGFADALRAAPRHKPRRMGVRFALTAAAVAGVVAIAVLWPRRRPELAIDLAATRWDAPTDFLLRTPGAELLRSVPALGSLDDSRVPEGRTPR